MSLAAFINQMSVKGAKIVVDNSYPERTVIKLMTVNYKNKGMAAI